MFRPIYYFFLFIQFLLAFPSVSSAQKEDYQWPLGIWGCPACYYRFFYDFNTDPPTVVVRNDSLSTSYCAASISNRNGDILAYSNGLRILNSAGATIENSEGLNPNLEQSEL